MHRPQKHAGPALKVRAGPMAMQWIRRRLVAVWGPVVLTGSISSDFCRLRDALSRHQVRC